MEINRKEILGAAYVRSAIKSFGQIEEQEELIKDYCEKNDIQIVRTYEDIAQSGLNSERPGMKQLITDAAGGQFGVVVTTSPDRIARNISVYLELVKKIKEHACIFFSEVPRLQIHTGTSMDVVEGIASVVSDEWFDKGIEHEIEKLNSHETNLHLEI
jgi:site-specific DNA recombinase